MQISFDIDDTLILQNPSLKQEPNRVPWYLRKLFPEQLRPGTCNLINNLIENNWEIAIYTTSYRSQLYIKALFYFYGIPLNQIINQKMHLQEIGTTPTKHPRHFGIDLHVDDSEGVLEEGKLYNFNVVVVKPNDPDWKNTILNSIQKLKHSSKES